MKKVYLVYRQNNWEGVTSWDLVKAFSRRYAAEHFMRGDAAANGRNLSTYRLQGIKIDETKTKVGNHDFNID